MSPAKATSLIREDLPTPDPDVEVQPEGFENGLAFRRVRFRGVDYKLVELSIGKYDDIEKLATITKTDVDGNEVESVNEQSRMRMMLRDCVVEPKGFRITSGGTRLILNLQRIMNELHYAPEVDELKTKKAKSPTAQTEEEEAPKGNG